MSVSLHRYEFLRAMPRFCYNVSDLFKNAFHSLDGLTGFTSKMVRTKRRRHLEEVRREMAECDARRSAAVREAAESASTFVHDHDMSDEETTADSTALTADERTTNSTRSSQQGESPAHAARVCHVTTSSTDRAKDHDYVRLAPPIPPKATSVSSKSRPDNPAEFRDRLNSDE